MEDVRNNINIASFSEFVRNMNTEEMKIFLIKIDNISQKNNKDGK